MKKKKQKHWPYQFFDSPSLKMKGKIFPFRLSVMVKLMCEFRLSVWLQTASGLQALNEAERHCDGPITNIEAS